MTHEEGRRGRAVICAGVVGVVMALLPGARPALAASGPIDIGTLGGPYATATAVSGTIVVGDARISLSDFRAFAYDVGASSPEAIDLGVLPGGTSSFASAVSGSLVVGRSYAFGSDGSGGPFVNGAIHAFLYDLASGAPEMTDLHTFGSRFSEATAVSGGVVVGRALVRDEDRTFHAFAYDLSSPEPEMLDLGTLGGEYSKATAVSHRIVTGESTTADGAVHAFVYDLDADAPRMLDLGTLDGFFSSTAVAIDGGVVVGNATTSDGRVRRAFAYDLESPSPSMIDLGSLGGPWTAAAAVTGSIVVGSSVNSAFANRAFAFDLDSPGMVDLGALDGGYSYATGISGTLVVGASSWNPDAVGDLHAFAYDLAADREMVDLDALDHSRMSAAVAVSGTTIAGWSQVAGAPDEAHHAVAWDFSVRRPTTTGLSSSPSPSILGATVTHTATVRPAVGVGTFTFRDAGTPIPGCQSLAPHRMTGEATCIVTYAELASHPITAEYSGTAHVAPSTSPTVVHLVGYGVKLLDDTPATSKAGSAVPMKLALVDHTGTNLSSVSVVLTVTGVDPSPGVPAPVGTFTFVQTLNRTGGYQFDLKTTGYAPGSYTLTFTATGDPVTHAVPFVLR